MKIVHGNLWDSVDDLILVTANSYITKDGRLVMGRGAALELKNKFLNIDYLLGNSIEHLGRYGLRTVHSWVFGKDREKIYGKKFGVFQVKYHFRDKADLELIKYSTNCLREWILYGVAEKIGISTISMNFPGIGFGHLNYNALLPIVEQLPDNVSLYLKD